MRQSDRRKRVVVAGLGDTGVLTAMHLARRFDVVGISVKPALVSGQELGVRISRPDDWARDNWIDFGRFRRLDRVRIVHATLTGVDFAARKVFGQKADGSAMVEDYDALVISTGVANGFWRRPTVQSPEEIGADLRAPHDRLASAGSVIVVGGGAAAVSSAANLARRWPDKRVELYFPGDRALPHHHPRTWERVRQRLAEAGVVLHPGHRAVIPTDFACDEITTGPVQWSTGQPAAVADAVLWATGRVRPNTGWLPADVLDEDGFVRVTPQLRVEQHPGVFAVGDVAATDPLRSSARNRGDRLVAHNVRAELEGRPLRSYRAPKRRWGSVIGIQADGLEVFAPNGRAFRFPAWSIDRVLMPWIVRRGIYGGVRDPGAHARTYSFVVTRTSSAPVAVVFRLATDGGRWSQWAKPLIVQSSWVRRGDPAPGGVGAVRKVGMWPMLACEETVEYEQDRRYVYTLTSPSTPVKDYRAEVTFTSTADGGTEVCWRGSFTRAVPGTARMMLALFRRSIEMFGTRLVKVAERESRRTRM